MIRSLFAAAAFAALFAAAHPVLAADFSPASATEAAQETREGTTPAPLPTTDRPAPQMIGVVGLGWG